MMTSSSFSAGRAVAARAGIGLKSGHYEEILDRKPDIGWFEIHAENYMGDGGPVHSALTRIRNDYPISCHGVGLSIGAARPLDRDHLQRLKRVCERYEPGLISEHLAWSTHDAGFLNDLLPVPYDAESLTLVTDHIDQVQETLGRTILLENPSTYVAFEQSTMTELDFLQSAARRTGCGLLLDINNVYVSATNQNYAPEDYLADFPMEAVGEIHLAGHATDEDDDGNPLLIDAHDRFVADPVWKLYESVIKRIGSRPSLIEWDNDVPSLKTLLAEAEKADNILQKVREVSSAA